MPGRRHNNYCLWLAGAVLLLAGCNEPAPGTQNSSVISARIERTQPYIEPYTADDTVVPQNPASPHPSPRIAIIIDDIGNHRQHGMDTINLPGAVTLSIMPHTPFGRSLANAAHAQQKEIMLHMPMSNVSDQFNVADTLTPDMSRKEFNRVLLAAMDSIPYASGLNNHTGSELTTLKKPMRWLMTDIASRGWFFIDSRTTAESVAANEAASAGIPYASRNVFLDNDTSPEAIDAAFQTLLAIARQQGQAIAIGHPYPETIAYLDKAITGLQASGIQLVYASELLHTPTPPSPPHLQEAPQHGTLAQNNHNNRQGESRIP